MTTQYIINTVQMHSNAVQNYKYWRQRIRETRQVGIAPSASFEHARFMARSGRKSVRFWRHELVKIGKAIVKGKAVA